MTTGTEPADIVRAYGQNQTTREIAAQVGHSDRWVRARLPKRRRRGPRGRTDIQTRAIVDLVNAGWTFGAVGRLLGMSRTGVKHRYCVAERIDPCLCHGRPLPEAARA